MGSTQSYTLPKNPHAGGPAPHLELCLECDRPLAGALRVSLADLDEVSLGRGTGRSHQLAAAKGRAALRVSVPDRWMSEVHGRLTRDGRAWQLEDAGSKNGTFVNGERVDRTELEPGDLVVLGHTLWRFVEVVTPSDKDQRVTELVPPLSSFATLSPSLGRHFEDAVRIAGAPVTVLIEGQTGTGKEVVARALHELSDRPGPFVAVNCGAIPASLIESELFGYGKGAFSGAVEDRPGLIRAADRGTLFLDEVGELSPPAQVALLRVLQEKEVLPLGTTRPISVDVRVVAATHQSIDVLREKGEFRADLKARLCGFRMALPPLAQRKEDLGALIGTLLTRIDQAASGRVCFTPAAACALFTYSWPANVRELEQALRAALALSRSGVIDLEHLPVEVREARAEPAGDDGRLSGDDLEQKLDALLRRHKGNIAAVARALNTSRAQVHRLCKRFGRDIESYR
jgi:transcriptional regulator with PAS, ATPase and Fis domain